MHDDCMKKWTVQQTEDPGDNHERCEEKPKMSEMTLDWQSLLP